MDKLPLRSYEHACSTLQALVSLARVEGVIPILYASQSCVYPLQVATMSCRSSRLLTLASKMNKEEIIFGGEDSLKNQILNTYREYRPRVIVVINTCISQLIGENVSGMLNQMQQEINDCKLTFCNTGFNLPQGMSAGNDFAWASLIEVIDAPGHLEEGSIGLVGRSSSDAEKIVSLEIFLKEAGIPFFSFPASHFEEMSRISYAETLCPVSVVPYLTCVKANARFGSATQYFEIPAGIEGTGSFLKKIALLVESKRLLSLIAKKEKEILPLWRKLKKEYARLMPNILFFFGSGNEFSLAKILAELGAHVHVMTGINNEFSIREKEILKQKYKVTFMDTCPSTLGDMIEELKPDAVFTDMHTQSEAASKHIPVFYNMLYAGEYGYDYALDFARNFLYFLKNPVYKKWEKILKNWS